MIKLYKLVKHLNACYGVCSKVFNRKGHSSSAFPVSIKSDPAVSSKGQFCCLLATSVCAYSTYESTLSRVAVAGYKCLHV